jgi:DNA-binding response OmpR family regulator
MIPRSNEHDAPRRLKVALAEDDELQRSALQEALQDEGFDVIPLEDGFELTDYLSLDLKAFADAIVADLNMPGRSGLDGLELARQKGLHVPIFVVSGEESVESRARVARLGNAVYFSKPIDPERLAKAIHALAQPTA